MLVLNRKANESIVIRDDIIVTVVDVRGGKVRLGVEAPKEVKVHRKEVYEKINGGATTSSLRPLLREQIAPPL